ncbi:MAG: flagellar biosynthesis protein FlhB [Rhodospirillales bacterium]
MAESDNDDSQKTEDPTPRRLEDARQKGQVVSSREVNHWFVIIAATIVVAMLAPGMAHTLSHRFAAVLEKSGEISVDRGGAMAVATALLGDAMLVLIAPLVILVLAAVGASLLQSGLVVSAEPIKPKLEKISPLAGVKRIFSSRSVVEFLKGLAKIAIVGAVGTMLVAPSLKDIEQLVMSDVVTMMDRTYSLTVRLLVGVVAVVTVVAILDYLFQRFKFLKEMRMSRQELKEEFKQTEGDPHIKGKLKQIRQERARRRMMARVPEAAVVVTNPTHFAIALKYELHKMTAPLVIAKGADSLALRIREVAKAHGIPIVENKPLAQALYATVEIDEEIPQEHYKAVAEVISFVFKLKGKTPRPAPAAPTERAPAP